MIRQFTFNERPQDMGKEIYTQEPGKYILKLAELLKQIQN